MARGGVTIDFTANLARFSSSIDKATEDLNRFQSNAQRVGKNLKGIFSGLGVALTVGGFAAATKAALNFADGIADAAEKTAFTTTKLQELSFAAGQNGVEFAQLEAGLARFTKRLGLARAGTGAAAETYRQLGIDLRQSNAQVFDQIVDTLGDMENETNRLALATRLFGDDAQRLAVVFRDGNAGLRQYAERAHDLGLILSDDLVQGASDANDQLDIMQRVLQVQLTRGLVELAPVITSIGQAFAEAAPKVAQFFNAFGSVETLSLENLERRALGAQREYARLQEQLARRVQLNAAGQAGRPGEAGVAFSDFFLPSESELRERLAKAEEVFKDAIERIRAVNQKASEGSSGSLGVDTSALFSGFTVAGDAATKASKKIAAASKESSQAIEAWRDDMDIAMDLIDAQFRELDENAARAFAGLEQGAKKTTTVMDDLKLVIEGWSRDVTDSLLDFRGDLLSIVEDLGSLVARMIVQRKVADPLVSGIGDFIDGIDFKGLFGNAQGGLYKVAGSGSVERPVAFTAQPGEYVQVYPKGAGPGGAGGVNINFNITSLDPQSAANVIVQNRETIVSVVRSAFNRAGSSPRMA